MFRVVQLVRGGRCRDVVQRGRHKYRARATARAMTGQYRNFDGEARKIVAH